MFSELIDYTRPKKIIDRKFIDNSGKLFTYNKTEYKKLIWRKINSIDKYKTYVILQVESILEKFELPNNYWNKFSNKENIWLGLLDFDNYYIIYDIDIVQRKDTWRKV